MMIVSVCTLCLGMSMCSRSTAKCLLNWMFSLVFLSMNDLRVGHVTVMLQWRDLNNCAAETLKAESGEC